MHHCTVLRGSLCLSLAEKFQLPALMNHYSLGEPFRLEVRNNVHFAHDLEAKTSIQWLPHMGRYHTHTQSFMSAEVQAVLNQGARTPSAPVHGMKNQLVEDDSVAEVPIDDGFHCN